MIGLVQQWANQLDWEVKRRNVILEGASDVRILTLAAELYEQRSGIKILDDDFSLLAAGKSDDGGVDGVNRRLSAARQIADADRSPDGSWKYRFIGVFDNDAAGRRALALACNFDRRILRYQDLFLLHPYMPTAGSTGPIGIDAEIARLNRDYVGLDWEIEDFLSDGFHERFQVDHPDALDHESRVADRSHRGYSRSGKRELVAYLGSHGIFDDITGLVGLLRSLRSYLYLEFSHIV